MKELFFELLRSNFRCGRMRNSRADEVAGRIGVPAVSLKTGNEM
ncbi:MAG: hypothetical protein ACI3XJ_08430 [Oscillospiraceae bacterium]